MGNKKPKTFTLSCPGCKKNLLMVRGKCVPKHNVPGSKVECGASDLFYQERIPTPQHVPGAVGESPDPPAPQASVGAAAPADRKHDPVNHPSHYTSGKIEVIDFIEDQKLGFCCGNAVKYIARAGKKDPAKTVEDLRKGAWYLAREISFLEKGKA